MKQTIELNWHIVCGQIEVEQLMLQGLIWSRPVYDQRHQLFLQIKYPDHFLYQGRWGPETLHLVNHGPYRGVVGEMHLTYDRYKEIAQWFLDAMYNT